MEPLRTEIVRDTAPGQPQHDACELGFLDHLRRVAMDCRAKPRTDLFKACALLHGDRTASAMAYSEAFVRCLPQALGQNPMLHSPGATEISFDEAWFLQLARACRRGDAGSVTFLLRSRVRPYHFRMLRFLVSHIAEAPISATGST